MSKSQQTGVLMTGKETILHFGEKILPGHPLTGKGKFNLDEEFRSKIYRDFYQYFCGKDGVLDPYLSFLISGNIGVGKTILLQVMQRVFPNSFYWMDADRLKTLVIENGVKQTAEDFGYSFEKNLLIDDVGLDDPGLKSYGNVNTVVSDIIYKRNKRWLIDKKYKTHIITNYTTDELIDNYGPRVVDRIFEQVGRNILVWKGKSLRTNGAK